MDTSTWIVGLDLDGRSDGALGFADWLTRAGDVTVGVHVLEAWTRPHMRRDIGAAVRELVERTCATRRLTPLARVTTLEAVRAVRDVSFSVEARESFGREYLRIQIRRFSGNISRTASFIGMERSALHRKLKALGIGDKREGEE